MADTTQGFQLAPQQQRLWALLHPGAAFHAQCAVLLQGELRGEHLRAALQTVVARHQALRTTFQPLPGTDVPVQVVAEHAAPAWREVDLRALGPQEQQQVIEQLFDADWRDPFDLAQGPLCRVALLALAADRHLLLIGMPALCADAATLANLLRELSQAYAGELPGDTLQYLQFAEWQNELLGDEDAEAGRAFWSRQGAGSIATLTLPYEQQNAEQPFTPYVHAHPIDGAVVARVEALAQLHETSVAVVLLACWQALLWRLTGQPEITIGYGCDGRAYAELRGAFGRFARSVPVRCRFGRTQRFEDAVRALADTTRDAYEWQDYFVPDEAESESPYVAIGFDYQERAAPRHAAGLTFTVERQRCCAEPFKLALTCVRAGDLLLAELHYDPARFSPHDIARVAEHFGRLAAHAAAAPHTPIGQLDLLGDEERARLLVEFNATGAGYPRDTCAHRLFERQVEHTPGQVAVAFGDQHLTYAELNGRANQLARYLRAQGVGPDVIVGVHMERSIELVVGLLGILKAGGAYLPLDMGYPVERLAWMVEDARASVLLTSQEQNTTARKGVLHTPPADDERARRPALHTPPANDERARRPALHTPPADHERARRPALHTPPADHERAYSTTLPANDGRRTMIDLEADWPTIAQEPAENLDGESAAENLAYVIYTSGSTGNPKGTMIPHRGLVNYLSWCTRAYAVAGGRGAPVHSPIGFDLTITSLFGPLLAGQRVLLLPEEQGIEALAMALRANDDLSLVKLTPSHLEILGQQLPADQLAGRVRALVIGGEALRGEHLDFWRANAPGTRLINEYGPTETVVGCCVYDVPAEAPLAGAIPIGRPIANTQLYILDANMQPVPTGIAGELYIGGDGLARGYLNRPDLTAERFVPNPFTENKEQRTQNKEARTENQELLSPAVSGQWSVVGGRLYRTGDLCCHRPDGLLEYLGRIDGQVKLRGYRIELGEVEAALRQHGAVRDCVAAVREDVPGIKRLVAYVVCQLSVVSGQLQPTTDNRQPTTDNGQLTLDLRQFLRDRLPDYMIPVAFVLLEALPLTANGKVDRRALPAPDAARPDLDATFVAPRTPEEAALAAIWAQVLRRERVGVHDNFFALGGDSILAIQVISKARQAGLQLAPRQMFQHQTVAELAAVAGAAMALPVEQGLVQGPVPLTPIQQAFFDWDLPAPHHYNQTLLLSTRRPLEPALLARALEVVLAHHDALRLRFIHGERWQQHNAPDSPPVLTHVDLSGLPREGQVAALEAIAAAMQPSLDLAAGPLLRVALFELGNDQPQRLLLMFHHLAVDGVSWRILMEDLSAAYTQLAANQPAALPAKTTSFQGWAERLLAYAQSAELEVEREHWLRPARVSSARLPRDHAEGANTVASARIVRVALGQEETGALLTAVPQAYHTQINDVLLTALAQAAHGWTGVPRLLVELEGHGREDLFADVDLSRTVGWFTTVFPVLLDLSGAQGPGAALQAVKEQLRQVPNRGIGYGVLRYLSPDPALRESLRSLPEPDIKFNYLGQVDQVVGDAGLFDGAAELSGPTRDPRGRREHLLEVTAVVGGGRLWLEWIYSEAIHERATIAALAERYLAALGDLIAHCQSPDAGGYTPSDFPEMRFSQDELDDLIAELSDVIEDQG